MASIKTSSKHWAAQYAEMSKVSESLSEQRDCAVRAVALATNTDYKIVHQMMKDFGRKDRSGTPMSITERVVARLGYAMKQVNPQEFIQQYPGRHKTLRSVTTHHPERFSDVWDDGNTYLFRTFAHILCVKNGVNLDWTKGSALSCRVIYRITKQ